MQDVKFNIPNENFIVLIQIGTITIKTKKKPCYICCILIVMIKIYNRNI